MHVQKKHLITIFAEQFSYNCPKNHYLCENNQCKNSSVICDGKDDCDDGSDETIGCRGMNFKGLYIVLIISISSIQKIALLI